MEKVLSKNTKHLLFLTSILSALFLVSFITSTAQQSCDGLNETQCNQAPQFCHWDPVIPKCVSNAGMSNCSNITSQSVCQTTQGCLWDSQQNKCLQGGGGPGNSTCVSGSVALKFNDSFDFESKQIKTSGNFSFHNPGGVADGVLGDSDFTHRGVRYVNYTNNLSQVLECQKWIFNETANFTYRHNTYPAKGGGIAPNDIFCVNYEDTLKYAKLQVKSFNNGSNVTFEYSYQTNGSNLFCEQGAPPGNQTCGDITNQTTCTSTPNCLWDYGQNKCVQSGGQGGNQTSCFNITNQTICQTSMGCLWDNSQNKCIQGGGFDCHSLNNSAECLNQTQCWWSNKSGGGECFYLDPNQPHCFMYDTNQTACNTTKGCEWVIKGNGTYCGPAGMGYCSQFDNNQSGCIGDPKCLWMMDFQTNTSSCGVNMGGGGMNPDCQIDCAKCTDPGMCGGSPKGCHWNFTINPNMCQDGQMNVNPCAGLPNPQCDNTFGCRYNASIPGPGANETHGECLVDNRMNISGCSSYPVESSCNGDPNCEWLLDQRDNKYKCMGKGSSDCGKLNNTADCEANFKCDWDYKAQLCAPAFSGGVCESMTDKSACAGTAGCKWDDFQWKCTGGSIVNCSAQNTSAFCNMYGECKWNESQSKCEQSPCASQCEQCSSSDACMKSPRGCWWDFGQAKCNMHMEPTCANGMCDMCNTTEDCYNQTLHPMNKYCGWFTSGPEYEKRGNKPFCNINTTCEQDCFRCTTQAGCIASNETLYANHTSACQWDPLSSWNPCFPAGQGGPGGPGPCDSNCTSCGDQFTCQGSPMGCSWNPSNPTPCSQSNCFTLGCSYCENKDNCMKADFKWKQNNATGCTWWMYSNGTQKCENRQCSTTCDLCLNENACGNSPAGCSWDNNSQKCNYAGGSSAGCNSNCSLCTMDKDCWGSYLGCRWIYEGHWGITLQNNKFVIPGIAQGGFTIKKNEALFFNNLDNTTHNLTIDNYSGIGFPLVLGAGNGSEVTFTIPGTYVIYDALLGKGVMNMTLTVNNDTTRICVPSSCKNSCGDCSDPGSCEKSYAGCFWDFKTAKCQMNGFGQTCVSDCYSCDTEVKCNASNATMFTSAGQMNGCQWIFDPIDGKLGCRPKGISFSCDNMCEMCNETQCPGAKPKMLPPESPGCKWFPNEMKPSGGQGMCHPDGFTGAGSNCPSKDYTSKVECESQPGCKWEDITQKCLINFDSITCDQMCSKCANKTQCDSKSPKCVWDTPSIGQPFCREDTQGGFKYGGNCQANCFDCFDNKSCADSTANCRLIKDMFAPSGYRCQSKDMPVCSEDCFACQAQGDCIISNNTLKANKSTPYCVWVDSGQFKYCKPNITMEICFTPGDEDGNGLADCKDPVCAYDPSCSFGGGGSMGMDKDCWQYGQMHNGSESLCQCGVNATLVNGTCKNGGVAVNETGCVWKIVKKPPFFNESEGICEPKFSDMVFGGMGEDMPFFILHDPCPPDKIWNTSERPVLENNSWLDICDIGIRDMPNTTAFILKLWDVKDLALCNFLSQGSENKSGKYYFMLDTDGNTSTGCGVQVNISEYDRNPANFQFGESGFEYRLDYEVGSSNGTATETRTVYQCVNGSWAAKQATVSGKKDKACEYQSIYFGILKSDLGNPSKTIRMIALTADENGGFSGGILYAKDRAYHAYYTPGTIDNVPPDCSKNPAACGSGYDANTGVMKFEDCFPGTGDEDLDGKLNCDDEDCIVSPYCVNQTKYDPKNDTTAPKIMNMKVDTQQNFARVSWSTDEPATGWMMFYGRNDTCETGIQNISQYDDSFFTMDNYRPYHDVPLDSNNPDAGYKLNYTLEPNTTYYFKLKSCDQAQNNASGTPLPNCAVTACLDFTTKLLCENITNETLCKQQGVCKWFNDSSPNCRKGFNLGFTYIPGSENPTDPLGSGTQFELNIGNQTINMSSGGQNVMNETTCNATLKFTNTMTVIGNLKLPWTIEVIECCLTEKMINLTNALKVGNNTNESLYVGMNSAKWKELAQTLGCKLVHVHLPGFHQDCLNITVNHCDENGENCSLVALDNATMIYCNSSISVWEFTAADMNVFSTYTKQAGVDAYAPRIQGTGPATGQITGSSATISWTTNELSNGTVNYRECDATYENCAQYPENLTVQGYYKNDPVLALSHTLTLTNLTTNTTYFYRITVMDASLNARVYDNYESYYRFTTTGLGETLVLSSGWNLIAIPFGF